MSTIWFITYYLSNHTCFLIIDLTRKTITVLLKKFKITLISRGAKLYTKFQINHRKFSNNKYNPFNRTIMSLILLQSFKIFNRALKISHRYLSSIFIRNKLSKLGIILNLFFKLNIISLPTEFYETESESLWL